MKNESILVALKEYAITTCVTLLVAMLILRISWILLIPIAIFGVIGIISGMVHKKQGIREPHKTHWISLFFGVFTGLGLLFLYFYFIANV